jgi:colanic acid biosynthesis glycosyl transferase WcaI
LDRTVDSIDDTPFKATDLRILIHGLNYAPEQVGVGKYTGELAEYLVRHGFTVDVVTAPPYYPAWKIGDGYRGGQYRSENINGVTVTRCPLWVPKRISGLKRILHLASFGLSSIPVVLQRAFSKPDVVIVIEPTMFCLPGAWLAARLCGAKTWLHIQDFEVDAAFELGILKLPGVRRAALAMEAFLMRRFDRVSSISMKMNERLLQKGVHPERIRLFPNWVDCSVIFPMDDRAKLKADLGLPKDKQLALYSGNIGEKQGLEIVVNAARRLVHRHDIHFALCGTGAALESLRDYAQGVENITWLPVQPHSRLNELLSAADIHLLPQRAGVADFVMPSKLTGMLASGRPVLATADKGTQLEQIIQGCGIVVDPEDLNGFVDGIERLLADEPMRKTFEKKSRQLAQERLDIRRVIENFVSELRLLVPTQVAPKQTETA